MTAPEKPTAYYLGKLHSELRAAGIDPDSVAYIVRVAAEAAIRDSGGFCVAEDGE